MNFERTKLTDKRKDYCILPTIDKSIKSMYRKGQCEGILWNGKERKQNYKIIPDKKIPSWFQNEPVIYYLSN